MFVLLLYFCLCLFCCYIFLCVCFVVIYKDKKIDFFGRFFGEKSVFSGGGKDFRVEKSSAKKSEKNRQKSPIFRKKSDIFPKKSDFSRKNPIFPDICVNCILGH